MNSLITAREKEMLSEELASARRINEELLSQQSKWDEFHRASEQISSLAALIGQTDTEEIKELKGIREKYQTLESEHATLQKRSRDQDAKVASNERAAVNARQSLDQAKQRAAEWERRAKDHEQDLRFTRDKLDEAEQAHAQLEEEVSMMKSQMEERDAEERLMKVSRWCLMM